MSFGNTTQGLILFLLATSLLAVGATRTIVVGGSENWKLGIDYSVWANQNKPFYFNDTLGEGFAYVLNKWRPHYFVSGEDNGTQCYPGTMKFFAAPTPARH
ncbi:GLYCINE-RICH PROTEIN-LIKE [Salix viminalis]|uniref:GLYCINE-RICH PROTEIN-LIKE n=1 Tax=Salix viminalis TaxID=40686 RepID=A0A9Q0NTS5_SALVM|nr:GLYCINE-RICH PROTEIN-LIKE [Salix viminalis]